MPLVGVTTASGSLRLPKRELLFFDKVAIVELSLLIETLKRYHPHLEPHMIDEYAWLVENELVFEPTADPALALLEPDGLQVWLRLIRASVAYMKVQQTLPQKGVFNAEELDRLSRGFHHLWSRLALESRAYAVALRMQENIDAVAIHNVPKGVSIVLELSPGIVTSISGPRMLLDQLERASANTEKPAQRSDVLRLMIERLPVPDESTPWEDILNFRRDPDTSRKLLAIREWTREVATQGRDIAAVEDKLDYLLEEYRAHIKLHKLKYSAGALETIITTTAEVAESLVKFKWKALAETLFSIRKRRIALLEAEACAPGREVSYIIHTQSKFGAV